MTQWDTRSDLAQEAVEGLTDIPLWHERNNLVTLRQCLQELLQAADDVVTNTSIYHMMGRPEYRRFSAAIAKARRLA